MSPKKYLAFWVLLGACSTPYVVPLEKRGMASKERYGYIIQKGYQVPPSVRDAFVAGRLVSGMDREYVFQLFGTPDRNSPRDDGWEYLDKNGRLVTGVIFRADRVDSIYGDSSGGASARAR